MVAEINATRVHVELDAKEVVDMLNHPARNLSAIGPWIQEIKTAIGMFAGDKISWVHRSAIVDAHKLAMVGVGDKLSKVCGWGSPRLCS